MKKLFTLLTKTLLVAVCLLWGASSAWAADITITWPMVNALNATTQAGSANADGVVTVNNASLSSVYTSLAWADARQLKYSSDGSTVDTQFYAGGVTVTNNPNNDNDNASVNTDCYVKFSFTVAAGKLFTPTGFSFECGRAGTDAGCMQGALVLADGTTKSTSTIVRPARTDKKVVYDSHVSKTITAAEAFEGGSTVDFYIYIGGKCGGKTLYLSDVTITGTYEDEGATNDPVDPTFSPDGGSIDGNSTVTVASTYAQKIFYYWSDSSTAPSQGDANYTEAEGASANVTVPNEAGTKYLHAYGWNNKNTNTYTSTITKTFTITVKALPELSYAEAAVDKLTTDANFTNPLTNPHSLAVTYSVEAGATATGVEVNASTGEVTIGSVAGTATIKATFAGNEDYLAGEATYVLTVTKPTCAVPTYTLGSYNYEQGGYEIIASCATDGATLEYKIGSGDYTACTAGVAFYAKNGKLVIKASKDGYDDATIASDIQWTLNVAPSLTSPETLIPFQISSDNGEKDKSHVYKSVTFGEDNAASSVAGISGNNGLKIRTNQTHGTFDNSIKFYVHSGYKVTRIQMTGNSNNTGATIDVNGMYVDGGDNAISSVAGDKTFPISSEDAATFNTGDIEATDNIVLTFDNSNIDGTSGKKNNQLKVNIVVTYEAITQSVTVTSAGYATYVPSYDLDFSATAIKAYKVKVNTKGIATMTKVDEVPAGTPVLLYKAGGATEDIPVMTGAAAVTENDLVAGTGAALATIDGEYTNMILNNGEYGIGFYFANDKTVASNRAYLHILTTLAPDAVAGAPMMLVFDNETSGVETLNIERGTLNDNNYYNLAGQRVAQPTKGLYIVNGKKVVIK